jgi:flagellar basal body rod protein FlgF
LAMKTPSEEEITALLLRIMTDGFNRSLNALRAAGAVNTKVMDSNYKGVGSKYHDLVTMQMEHTAKYGTAAIRNLFHDEPPSGVDGP